MSREVRRVPEDFAWPLQKTWEGYLMPSELRAQPCPDCEIGYAPEAQHFYDQWYGKVPFDPRSTGSEPFLPEGEEAMAWAQRQIEQSPEFYGRGALALRREAERITKLWNARWMHHLSQEDVEALLAEKRLMSLTHRWTGRDRWQPKQPAEIPTAAEVNRWSLFGMGHDSINAFTCVRARCEREGIEVLCPTCGGSASVERFSGQRGEAAQWKPTDPPSGEGWQLWETVSEGSPVTPVFGSAEELGRHLLTRPELMGPSGHSFRTVEEATTWITDEGWAPSGMFYSSSI